MNARWIVVILIFAVASVARAEPEVDSSPAASTGKKPKFLKKYDGGLTAKVTIDPQSDNDKIEFLDKSDKNVCDFVPQEVAGFFTGMSRQQLKGYEHPVFVSEWTAGIRGEELHFFDPALGAKCDLGSLTTDGYFEYSVDGDHLSVTEFRESETGEQEKNASTWKPAK